MNQNEMDARHNQIERIGALLKKKNAFLIAHYYTDPEIQKLAEYTGGFIGDSLAMAEAGQKNSASILIVAGVRFMGETAKILNPEKKILMPTLEATCSLDLGCSSEQFRSFRELHPDRIAIVYANTSASVKAQSDWVVTSSNALAIVRHVVSQNQKILWAPDRYLGRYIQEKTQADLCIWNGSCIVHEEYQADVLAQMMTQHPDAAVLVHPESPEAVMALATVIGSTTALLKASYTLPHLKFIVATDRGLLYKMQQSSPHKIFLEAPTSSENSTCRSCGHCPWMALNTLSTLEQSVLFEQQEIVLDEDIMQRARVPLLRMMQFGTNETIQ